MDAAAAAADTARMTSKTGPGAASTPGSRPGPGGAPRRVGLIVPPAGDRLPPEAEALAPASIRFHARSLDLGALTLEDYAAVIDRVGERARALRAEAEVDAVALMGTSLSFFRGAAFNRKLVAVMREAAGRPATTMSSAIIDALGALGARRVAVATAYIDAVNARLRAFLGEHGLEVVALKALGMTDVDAIRAVNEDAVVELAHAAVRSAARTPDAVLVSCGGLRALTLAERVEAALGLPLVASATAGLWGAARLVGVSLRAPALGALARVAGDAA